MSVRVFRWILVITNLILILIPISALVLSYFFLVPKVLDAEIDRATATLSAAFTIWAVVLILTSICFLGITFTNSCCLHLISALLLAGSAALSAWLVVDQFLNHPTPNWTLVSIAAVAAFIWTIQVLTELLLSCILCCRPSHASCKNDAEAAKKAEAEDGGKKRGDDGTDEEKEKLVLYQHNNEHNNSSHANSHSGSSGPGGAFVPSPQAPPIEEVDEDGDEDDEDEEDEDDEEEADSQAGIRMIDRNNPNHPHDLQLRSIPEEKQHLLHGIGSSGSGLRPMSRSSQGSGGQQQCPLATPEDTGV